MSKDVILTGLRTNAEYHLGNYLGGIMPIIELQKKFGEKYQMNMFAPDLHSFTTEIDHRALYRQTIDNVKVFIAAGLDIDQQNTYIYRQSFVPQHSELTVILNNFAYFGELSRMAQFKEKTAKESNVTAGLFDYPVLMAADILLYGAKYIPVGDDQRQHIELARDVALRMNNKFAEVFPEGIFVVPEPFEKQLEFYSRDSGVRIRSLRHPENKMSKSVQDPAGTIQLSDTPEDAHKKIKSATTDNLSSVKLDFQNQPGISNLLQILALLNGEPLEEVARTRKGQSKYGDLKTEVADSVAEFLSLLQKNLANVDEEKLISKLEASEQQMREQASRTLERVQQAVGLREL